MSKKKKVAEIAKVFGVTPYSVYMWINNGLKTEIINEIGKKPYQVIDPEDVKTFRGVK